MRLQSFITSKFAKEADRLDNKRNVILYTQIIEYKSISLADIKEHTMHVTTVKEHIANTEENKERYVHSNNQTLIKIL